MPCPRGGSDDAASLAAGAATNLAKYQVDPGPHSFAGSHVSCAFGEKTVSPGLTRPVGDNSWDHYRPRSQGILCRNSTKLSRGVVGMPSRAGRVEVALHEPGTHIMYPHQPPASEAAVCVGWVPQLRDGRGLTARPTAFAPQPPQPPLHHGRVALRHDQHPGSAGHGAGTQRAAAAASGATGRGPGPDAGAAGGGAGQPSAVPRFDQGRLRGGGSRRTGRVRRCGRIARGRGGRAGHGAGTCGVRHNRCDHAIMHAPPFTAPPCTPPSMHTPPCMHRHAGRHATKMTRVCMHACMHDPVCKCKQACACRHTSEHAIQP
eukprot:355299-Chlamydomonas_euryale.AAC.7